MDISIKNCNNIDFGILKINKDKLNIKYAINGTGKSTISKAISSCILDKRNNSRELEKLKPFKHKNSKDNNPEINGIDGIDIIKIYDEEYLNKYVFLPDELIKGSFDIFIRDGDYEKGMNEINELMSSIQNAFVENKDIDELIADFEELSSSFGKPVKTGIHGSSNFSKAFKDGNKVINVPDDIEEYKNFIQADNNYQWIKWLIDGMVYLDLSNNCPYCITDISKKKSKILRVKDLYDPKAIEYLNKIVAVFSRLDKYFSDDTKRTIKEFISNINGYTDDQVQFLLGIKEQIERLSNKFVSSKTMSFKTLKDVDKIVEVLKNQKIDLKLYTYLNSESTEMKAEIINKSIDKLLEKTSILQGKINIQKLHIEKIISENNEEINAFLKNAGFNYHVNIIEDEKNQYSLKLIHNDVTEAITDVKNHLSFGEKNAFSVVLFMYDALKSNADLIVLDDPISSFDKHKKYAIIDMLFRKSEKSLRNKTVLLLTHDFEPILDMVYHHNDRFEKPYTCFVENDHGNLCEKEITREKIKSFVEICDENINKDINDITKLVYLRRYYEILNEKGNAYQLISNLLHRREIPIISPRGENIEMEKQEIEKGSEDIREKIINFDYNTLSRSINNNEIIKRLYQESLSNYEKLHLFRVLFGESLRDTESIIITKFINEAFHIENDYIYQLNPCEYQLVPQYVIDECDKQMLCFNNSKKI